MNEYDGWDGLGICPVCGDVETLGGRLCRSCEEQRMIDNDPNPPPPPALDMSSVRHIFDHIVEELDDDPGGHPSNWADLVCIDCGRPYTPETGQFTLFGNWFCNDCMD